MSRRGWLLFATMSVVWGLPYLMIKVAVTGVSAEMLVFTRTVIGAALLLPLAVRSARKARAAGTAGAGTAGAGAAGAAAGADDSPGADHWALVRRHWRPLIVFALIEMIVPWWLLSDAERVLSSSMTGLLIAVVPILGAVLGRLTGDAERIGAQRGLGLLVGFGGVALLAAPHLGGGAAWPMAEVLLTALGYAVAPMIAVRRLPAVPALPMTAVCLAFAALVHAPGAIATWPHAVPRPTVLAALAGLGVVCTAFAFVVFLALIREAGPARAMVFTYVNPAVAVVAGVIFLNEPLSMRIAGAFLLILLGSVLATAPGSGRGPVSRAWRRARAASPGGIG